MLEGEGGWRMSCLSRVGERTVLLPDGGRVIWRKKDRRFIQHPVFVGEQVVRLLAAQEQAALYGRLVGRYGHGDGNGGAIVEPDGAVRLLAVEKENFDMEHHGRQVLVGKAVALPC